MALDPGKPVQQAKMQPGTDLVSSGQSAEMLLLVHQGEVAVLNPPDGRLIYRLGPNTSPGFGSLVEGADYPYRITVSKPSVISAFPVVRNKGFTGLVLGKLNVAMLAVKTVAQEIIQAYQTVKRLEDLAGRIQRTFDNTSLAYSKLQPQLFEKKENAETTGDVSMDPVMPAARLVVDTFLERGGEVPEAVNRAWLDADHSSFLDKDYSFDANTNMSEFEFLKRILALPPNLQGQIYSKDIQILQGIAGQLSELLNTSIQDVRQLLHGIDEGLESLVTGEYSYSEKLFIASDLFKSKLIDLPLPEFRTIIETIYTQITQNLQYYKKLFGKDYPNIGDAYPKLKDYVENNPDIAEAREQEQQSAAASVFGGADPKVIRKNLEGSAAKILSFVGIPTDESKKMLQNLEELKKSSNPLDTTPELRKLRRAISATYWKAYEQGILKYRESQGNVPDHLRLMLQFGYFDETLLDDEHLVFLHDAVDTTKSRAEYPVYYAVDWINRVAKKDEIPSIDAMGLTMFEKLKQEHKDKGWKKESDLPDEYQTPPLLVHAEITNFLEENVRLTSGTPASAFPILTRYQITMDLDRSFVTRQKLSEAIDKLLSTDYSAFHREVIINDEKLDVFKEFVQKQVIPNFILVPSIGTKIMMWQDLAVARIKDSRGRIAVPVLATADLYTLLLDAIGAFRWELTKTVLGADWNNVSNSSLTADYTDYVQFYKKNRDLSPEIKEKLAAEFKRFRNDRDRFVNDYINWVKFESDGVLKLNKVARSIMYRHVPFAKAIRDDLANQPAYADLQNRFSNIRKKKLHELEVRYRKYGEYPNLPEVLKNNVDFFKV